jgi:hypothetical protein
MRSPVICMVQMKVKRKQGQQQKRRYQQEADTSLVQGELVKAGFHKKIAMTPVIKIT